MPKKKEQVNKSVCFYFHVHQPYRLSKFDVFAKEEQDYFKGLIPYTNRFFIEKVGEKCYYPTNQILHDLMMEYDEFRCSFSISGVMLEQFEEFDPKLIESFQSLVKTKKVELLNETYYHSLAWIYSKLDFTEQVLMHRKKIYQIFKKRPVIFRNTELIYNNELANFVKKLGFKGILAEGWDPHLGDKSPNYVYKPPRFDLHPEDAVIADKHKFREHPIKDIPVLLKNYRLSDDIAFRFSDRGWKEHPLSVKKFADWVEEADGNTINLFMDYETFGEHQWEDSGIFEFLKRLPGELLSRGITFKTPSETIAEYGIKDEIDMHDLISWADIERDLSAWLGNKMQQHSADVIYQMESLAKDVAKKSKSRKDKIKIIDTWRKLQTSDHFYYMSTKYWSDGDIHKYFSPYDSPYDAYINYMNVVTDFLSELKKRQ